MNCDQSLVLWKAPCSDQQDVRESTELCDAFRIVFVSSNLTRFVITDDRLPDPAPPPRLHYSTKWRLIIRRIYKAAKGHRDAAERHKGVLNERKRLYGILEET